MSQKCCVVNITQVLQDRYLICADLKSWQKTQLHQCMQHHFPFFATSRTLKYACILQTVPSLPCSHLILFNWSVNWTPLSLSSLLAPTPTLSQISLLIQQKTGSRMYPMIPIKSNPASSLLQIHTALSMLLIFQPLPHPTIPYVPMFLVIYSISWIEQRFLSPMVYGGHSCMTSQQRKGSAWTTSTQALQCMRIYGTLISHNSNTHSLLFFQFIQPRSRHSSLFLPMSQMAIFLDVLNQTGWP